MLVALLLLFPPVHATCPPSPELRDDDEALVVLAQNLKFIATGARREARAALLGRWLDDAGADVDLLLLSEARLTRALERTLGWCYYTQAAEQDGRYAWAPVRTRRPPGGLALGVRQRALGRLRRLGGDAGATFRTRPTSFAEGVLGRIVHYRKGWASVRVDGTHVVWSHAQASYAADPARGAGARAGVGVRAGRAGQLAELADALGTPTGPTAVTGDLNLLDGFDGSPIALQARARDERTVTWFAERTGVDLRWFRRSTYAGSFDTTEDTASWDLGAAYDRVGTNAAFHDAHPGARAEAVDIREADLRVSDHLGVRLTIPFLSTEAALTANP